MGKRQQRLIGMITLEKFNELMELPLTIVLKNGTSYTGVIFKVQQGDLFVKDQRRNVHCFSPNDIAEVILEKVSAY